jgi:hypothetical protein
MSEPIQVSLATLAAEVRALLVKFLEGSFHIIPDSKDLEVKTLCDSIFLNVVLHNADNPLMILLTDTIDPGSLPAKRLDQDLAAFVREFPDSLLRRLCDSLVQLPVGFVIPDDDLELLTDFDEGGEDIWSSSPGVSGNSLEIRHWVLRLCI